MSARPEDVVADALDTYGGVLCHGKITDERMAVLILAALRAAGYAIVSVGSQCPFDRIDHGGLLPEDPCPICGDLGTFSPTGKDEPSRCISNRRHI